MLSRISGKFDLAEAATRKPRPRLRFHCRVESFAPEHVIIFAEETHHILRGRAFVELMSLLDGHLDVESIIAELAGRVPLPEIYYALQHLEDRDLLDRAIEPPPENDRSTWLDTLGGDTAAAVARLETTCISLIGAGESDTASLAVTLTNAGVKLAERGGDLSVVVAGDYLDPELEAVNDKHLASGAPWLLLRPSGLESWIGPLFVAGEACWECLAHRLRESRQAETWLASRRPGTAAVHAPAVGTAATRHAALQLAATEILKWAAFGLNAGLAGNLLTVNFSMGEVKRHVVVRRPQCAVCGDPRARQVVPVRLRANAPADAETEVIGAGPEHLLARVGHHISPLTGIAHAIERQPCIGSPLIHNAVAVHYFPMFKDDPAVLQKNLRGRSGGKGSSEIEARAGAVGEAIERYSGVWQGDWEITRRGSFHDFGDQAVNLESLLLFSTAQYANRQAWNRKLRSPHQVVPAPLTPDRVIDWTPAWSLTQDIVRYLPAAYCWYGHPELADLFCLADSNGCAAGPTLEWAILGGLLELIERDAVGIWWYNRLRRPTVDIASFADPYLDELCAHYRALGRDVWLLDVSTEFDVPVFVALSARRGAPTEDIIFGFAAHPDAACAARHALTELNQSYTFVAESGPGNETVYRAENAEMLDWLRTATNANQPYLLPAAQSPLSAQDFVTPTTIDPSAAVRALLERLRIAGHEVLVVDQTRPDIGLPVARVVVPGLRHFWRRLGPGRLYDVPVRLGWCERPCCETDLNPYSIFI
jgi:ribosomal protein S12 methylthiotransferase accessory factor